jgi:hypothetical protein
LTTLVALNFLSFFFFGTVTYLSTKSKSQPY